MKSILTLFLMLPFLSFANNDDVCRFEEFGISNVVIEVTDNSRIIPQEISVRRDRTSTGGSNCSNYRIFFSTGLSFNYQRRAFSWIIYSITYNLHKQNNQSGVLKSFSDAENSNEYLEGFAPSRETTYTIPYYISVPGLLNNTSRSGTYIDIVEARLYALVNNSWRLQETRNVTYMFYVPKSIQVSLLDEGGTFDASSTSKVMDFGILSQNQEKGADLRVLSNGSYQIRLSSQNNGFLKYSGGESISYSLRVNNSLVSLAGSASSPVQIGQGDSTSSAGDLYNLKVRITENTQTKSAGMYQDVITITAIAN